MEVEREKEALRRMLRDGDAPRSVPLPSGTTSFWPTAFT